MEKNKKILILEGGKNEEHEVSLKTSREIKKALGKLKIEYKSIKVDPNNFEKKIIKYKNYICINALHGPFGEDGEIQKILNKNKIKFTHSSYRSSRNCFDKHKSKTIISKNKILTPKSILVTKNDLNHVKLIEIKKIFKKFVIKPTKSGSSFGIKIIKNKKDFRDLINNIGVLKHKLKYHNEILIEEFISGKELTVSTIKFLDEIKALAVTEINSKNSFFDYIAKYSKGYAKHILPAKINVKDYNKCLNLALKCHKILKCNSIARTDFILNSKNKKIYFLEINTQPGLTLNSLLPEQARYRKIKFNDIVLGMLNKLN